jgi:error-prone DNA polymerase
MSAQVFKLRRAVLPYTELKSSTYFSFLKGASSPQQMVEEALRLNLNGIAITDIGGVYGAPRAYQALKEKRKKHKELSLKRENGLELSAPDLEVLSLDAAALEKFKLIIGCELLIRPDLLSDGTNVSHLRPGVANSAIGIAQDSAHRQKQDHPLDQVLPLPSIVMLAPNRAAYGGMCRVLTESHRGRPKGTGDLSFLEFQSWLKLIPHAKDLILFPQWETYWQASRAEAMRAQTLSQNESITAIGALAVKLANAQTLEAAIRNFESESAAESSDHSANEPIQKKTEPLEKLFAQLLALKKLDNPVYIPVSRHRDGLDQERTEFAKFLAEKFNWKCVAHQGALYHNREQQVMQDVLTSIQETIPLKELGLKLKTNAERRLKSPEEMGDLFLDFQEAIVNAEEVNARCTFKMDELVYQYPSEWIPEGVTAQEYLEALCMKGLKNRYGDLAGASAAGMQARAENNPSGEAPQAEHTATLLNECVNERVNDRVGEKLKHDPEKILTQLRKELDLVKEMNYAHYFLTVYDIVEFANQKNILCQGRGSAANSIVCYVLGITALDPIQMNFLFERFISVERGEPPDIDVDFEHERREEVIQYIYQKYGRNRAAMVSAVVTFRERSALREVAKAFSVPVGTRSAREVRNYLIDTHEVTDAVKLKVAEVAARLEDFPRHLSIHSGGFTLTDEPIDTIVPIEPATMDGRTIVQWDKYDLDILGLLKIDVLSLGMLTLLQKALISTGHKLHTIPHNDPATYRMIQRADTIGVFQIESRAQMSMLPRLKPACFYDLVVEIALVRPGPIVGKMVHPYLQRRKNPELVHYHHEKLKPILGKTYGVPIFQEQVMKIAIELGGFSGGEADRLRRAIGAWRSAGSIDEMGKKLQEGLKKNGLPEEFCQQIFDQIQGFAEYGFPESHSASFSLLAYASSYLKCHHPAAFLTAILNSQPMGFYSPHSLVDDAKRHGVQVLPICVNASTWDCQLINENTVRLGLSYVGAFPEAAALKLIEGRNAAPFKSFAEFIARTEISPRHLKALALASSFEALGLNSRDSLFEVLSLQENIFRQSEVQENLFSAVQLPVLSEQEKVMQDYSTTGLSVRSHPTEFLRSHVKKQTSYRHEKKWIEMNSGWVRKHARNREFIRVMGMSVVVQRPPTAKGTAFATLEDEHGVLDLIFHQKVFTDHLRMIREEAFLWVSGEVQRDGDALQIVVRKVEKIFKEESELDRFILPIAPGAHQKRV